MNGHQTNPITKPYDTRCNTIMETESGNKNFISSAIVTDQSCPASFCWCILIQLKIRFVPSSTGKMTLMANLKLNFLSISKYPSKFGFGKVDPEIHGTFRPVGLYISQ